VKSRPEFIAWHRPDEASPWRPIWSAPSEAQVLATAKAMQKAAGGSGGVWEVRPVRNPPTEPR
jgi:hypothetical protein